MTRLRRAVAVAVLAAAAACSRGGDGARSVTAGTSEPAAFDWTQPRTALGLSADDAAARLGSFEWSADVSWRVDRGEGSRSVTATERHRLRQLADGAFEVDATVDDGRGPGSETGREIVFVNGTTYAKGRWAPFRERSTDRGHDARRFRDESFRLGGDVAALCGPALRLVENGTGTVAGRAARRFTLTLDPAAVKDAQRPSAPEGRSDDPDTRARLEFLEGAVPRSLEGELLADAGTGVPLRVWMRAGFGVPSDPALRTQVTLDARMTGFGGAVAAVHAPRALPDERKPNGVASALETAGLKQKAQGTSTGSGERAEPQDAAE